MICEFCGHKIKQRRLGRPRAYHVRCRRVKEALATLTALAPKVRLREERARTLRGDLWRLGNLVVDEQTGTIGPKPTRGHKACA